MSIEEIMKGVTINLPKPLTLKETEDMLEYIGKKLPCSISYNASYYMSIIPKGGGEILRDIGTVKIKGMILSKREGNPFDSFECGASDSDRDTSKISVMRFSTVPDWDISDYRPKVRGLWKEVKGIVEQYFASKKQENTG